MSTCLQNMEGFNLVSLFRYFVDLHLRNSVPTIVVSRGTIHSGLDLFALDNWWEPDETMLMRHTFPFYCGKFTKSSRAQSSYDGLIVLHEYIHASFSKKEYKPDSPEAKFIILNPARPSHECVTINLPKGLHNSQMHGVYFHPLLNEYCALLEIEESTVSPLCLPHEIKTEYKVLNLGFNPSLKTIRNPCGGRRKLGYAKPLLINNNLYWMIDYGFGYTEQGYNYGGRNDVMKFDTISEEFTVIPCPVPLNTECEPQNTRLLNIDGILFYILILSRKITIWRLEDNAEQLWTATEYTVNKNVEIRSYWVAVGGIAVVDGKLAILSSKTLYVYDILEGTVKSIPKSLLEATVKSSQKRKYSGDAIYLSHKISLASLENCKTTIFITKDGEVAQDKQEHRTLPQYIHYHNIFVASFLNYALINKASNV